MEEKEMGEDRKRAVVIGSGIGGSAIATLLASRHFHVTVLERHPFIGGRCSSREKKGFIIDEGVHQIGRCQAGPIGEVLKQIEKEVRWSYTRDPVQKLYYLGQMVEYPKEIYKLGANIQDYQTIISTITKMPWDETFRLDEINVKDWLLNFTTDQTLLNIFSYITVLYFVIPYWEASAGEFVRSFQEIIRARSSGYPLGGCRVIPETFLKNVIASGGEVKTSAPVKRIIIQNGKTIGVMLEDDSFIPADIVISNVDPVVTINELTGKEYFPSDYIKKVESIKFAGGAFVLKLALDRILTREKFIMKISHPITDTYYQELKMGKIPDQCDLMVVVNSNFDFSLAPEGKQLITAGTFPVYNNDWGRWHQVVLNALEEMIPGIKDHILFEEQTSADEIKKLFGEMGSVIGMAQSPDQVGEKRLSQTTPISNLYLVGAEAGGIGIGTELAAKSALELDQMIRSF